MEEKKEQTVKRNENIKNYSKQHKTFASAKCQKRRNKINILENGLKGLTPLHY